MPPDSHDSNLLGVGNDCHNGLNHESIKRIYGLNVMESLYIAVQIPMIAAMGQ